MSFWQTLPSRIDPVLFHLGPFSLQWYSLMYVSALFTAYWLARRRLQREPGLFPPEAFEDAVPWIVMGVVIGARAAYVLFYDFHYFLSRPWEIVLPFTWEGGFRFTGIRGLSYHGGAAGSVLGGWLFCRRRKLSLLRLGDLLAAPVAFGYTFGRIGNFLNGELWGRATSVPWGMYFPADPSGLLRHPSQLYEAAVEGLLLGALVSWAGRRPRPIGHLLAVNVGGYGLLRFALERFREPDAHLGFVLGPFTMGQLLCLASVTLAGFLLVVDSKN